MRNLSLSRRSMLVSFGRRRLSAMPSLEREHVFPSLAIMANKISPRGPFAETQAAFMEPEPRTVLNLDEVLKEKNIGIVAHFYMDAELQGTLSALKWPHVTIADSLAMGDAAVKMAEQGVTSIACLGVDFMSESVKASLDSCGFTNVPVYRLSEKEIGCSLASAAEKLEYEAWLRKASKTKNSLHIVYINTSLITKAKSHSIVPTITCTSSNVIRTILQAFDQIPDLTVWYGPDTYMGSNLFLMLEKLSNMPNDKIRDIHMNHSQESIKKILPKFQYFKQGNCIVHHMFSNSVVSKIRENYADAYHTAHLEVPGEMFELAMHASTQDKGVIGSTSDILNFIKSKTLTAKSGDSIKIVLGTESGMISSIVRGVQTILRARKDLVQDVTVEIVFPVANESISVTEKSDMGINTVPGFSGSEGCSTSGGCATCPYMKMNDLDSLIDLVSEIRTTGTNKKMQKFLPRKRQFLIGGLDKTSLGVEPILHMRHFMKNQKFSSELVDDVKRRNT